MGYPAHLVQLLSSLYKKQKARVKVAQTVSRWFHVRKGVRQGCVLSPYLFNIVAEMAMRKRWMVSMADSVLVVDEYVIYDMLMT